MNPRDLGRFAQRTIDPDTRILSSKHMLVEGREILAETWRWEGIAGKSLIFLSEQVAGLTDPELEALARDIANLGNEDKVTLKRGAEFTFFNYAFRS